MSCGTVADLISLVREQMGDECAPVRNSDAMIINRINLALLSLYALRPDSVEPTIQYLKLEKSKTQMLPENSTMFEFLGTAYKDGNVYVSCETAKPTESSDDFLAAYAGRCPSSTQDSITGSAQSPCGKYSIKSFAYEKKNGRILTIEPAPSVNDEAYAKLLVSSCPQCTPKNLQEELPCKYYAAIYEKTMAYMYDAESEDAANANNSQRHANNFEKLVGLQYQTDARIGSGYYLGQKPDGSSDPNVRRG
jgi:tRNA U34 5-carboxymethylaminomethyl modifying enzyme MnmG/GidA